MKILQINDFLVNKLIIDEDIFVGKIKNSYLIGPKINNNLAVESFYKRITSSSMFELTSYKKLPKHKAQKLIKLYGFSLADNEVLEISNNIVKTKHKIIKIPEVYNEK